jgi:hypothetical protein
LAEAKELENPALNIPCPEPNCLTTKNKPRQANQACGRKPVLCAVCCRTKGGCNVHRLTTRDYPSVPALGSAVGESKSALGLRVWLMSITEVTHPPPEMPRRTFARPLDPSYGKAYIQAHRHLLEANVKVEEEAKLKVLESNTFDVVLWKQVRVMARFLFM